MKSKAQKGLLVRHLPTPVYFYGMQPGSFFTLRVPAALAESELRVTPSVSEGLIDVPITLLRVGPLKSNIRVVAFSVNGSEQVSTLTLISLKIARIKNCILYLSKYICVYTHSRTNAITARVSEGHITD